MFLPLDLETTGLDYDKDRILEVAWTWLTDDFRQTKSIESRIVTPGPIARQILDESSFVRGMHEESGLLAELDQPGTLMIGDVEDLILKDISEHTEKDTTITLMGLGPHFDQRFLEEWMPRLFKKLSYRLFDVRTLTRFFDVVGVRHDVINLNKHRAAHDVAESIAITQHYRDLIAESVPWRTDAIR